MHSLKQKAIPRNKISSAKSSFVFTVRIHKINKIDQHIGIGHIHDANPKNKNKVIKNVNEKTKINM